MKLLEVFKDDFWIMPATPEYVNEGVPYITSKNIKKGKINYEKINYISYEVFLNISKNRPILENDILISMIGTIGETAVVTKEDGEFYGQNMYLVRLNEDIIDRDYFLYFFNSSKVKNTFKNKQNKSTQSYLKANHIQDLEIILPTLEEQKQKAEELNKIKRLIDSKNKQLELLDKLVKARFVEMFGDPKTNNKCLILVNPEDICESISAGGDKPKEVSNVQTEEFRYPIFSNGEKDNGLYGWSKEYRVEKPSITVSGRGTIGFTVFRETGKFTPIVRLIVMTPNEKVNPIYLAHYMNMERETGSGSGVQQLTVPMIKSKKVMLPKIELQNQFAEFCKQVDKSKFAIEEELKQIQLLFESLKQKYFG